MHNPAEHILQPAEICFITREVHAILRQTDRTRHNTGSAGDVVTMETVHTCLRWKECVQQRKMASVQKEIFTCVVSGDLETIREHFKRDGDTEDSQGDDLFGMRDEVGRNAMLTACMLGRSDMARELVAHGARVDEQTVRGYSSLHLAACWGHLETVRTLLELGADIQAKTFRGERPVDLAKRYSKTDCADCLVLADAKQDLISYVAFAKDLISDPERKLSKEEKNICTRACSAKSDWIQSVKNSSVSDFVAQKKDIEDTLQPILNKLSAQSEGPVKPAGKV
ncbi:ankyrin repeat domain-containing protein 45 isoform X2 [Micropterus salmoides]|uniref:ankyrin repeat domain-containing protein 45-like isoform X2 n=1 Tax=Micropterus salmoides TaxID=27706 RepID=UPI0018ED711C|nr:ankyrin repeat domain-containing protein 45-like isoform X2 [Micropterus salmoides]XP_038574799.1 ankyrin repeat domain-containing protein 45 isoform X2 [Micropterus salmoides]